jgi:hypothetical protein
VHQLLVHVVELGVGQRLVDVAQLEEASQDGSAKHMHCIV